MNLYLSYANDPNFDIQEVEFDSFLSGDRPIFFSSQVLYWKPDYYIKLDKFLVNTNIYLVYMGGIDEETFHEIIIWKDKVANDLFDSKWDEIKQEIVRQVQEYSEL